MQRMRPVLVRHALGLLLLTALPSALVLVQACGGGSDATATGTDDASTSDSTTGGGDGSTGSDGGGQNDGSAGDTGTDGSLGTTCAPLCTVTPCTCDVAVTNDFACALLVDGSVSCWGQRTGVRADGGTASPLKTTKAMPVDGLPKAHAIAGGQGNVCVVTDANEVYCWGQNGQNQLGYSTNQADLFDPRKVPGLANVAEVSLGQDSLCARIQGSGEVKCLGLASNGAIGVGLLDSGTSFPPFRVNQAAPMLIQPPDAGADVDAGPPVPVTGVAEIGVSYYAACVRFPDAGVVCAGDNGTYGNLGTLAAGAHQYTLNAAYLAELGDAGTASLGPAHTWHRCAVSPSGETRCWGLNDFQAAAPAAAGNPIRTPYLWSSLPPMARVSCGFASTCGVATDGAVYCWGDNQDLESGSPDAGGGPVGPTKLPLPAKATSVSISGLPADTGSYACARLETGAVYCWGENVLGASLGRGSASASIDKTEIPAPVVFGP